VTPERPDPFDLPPVRPSAPVPVDALDDDDGTVGLYRAVETEGERELARPAASLWWSGIAAGTCMSMSVLATGLLKLALPDGDWSELVTDLGYVTGFLIVVLGRMQLFTENTITTVLPMLGVPSLDRFGRTMRLWAIVLTANLVGAFVTAVLLAHAGLLSELQLEAILGVAHEATQGGPLTNLGRAVPAGFLVAAMVWTAAGAPESRFSIVVALTYLIALGDFAHVIAGSVEVALCIVTQGTSALGLLGTYALPALFGNVVGGTLLFALIAYAQVREELPDDRAEPESGEPPESEERQTG